MSGQVYSSTWREDHVTAGDQALSNSRKLLATAAKSGQDLDVATAIAANAAALAAIAQAHYAAANVRARPIRDVRLPTALPLGIVNAALDVAFTTGPYRQGGCVIARFDHASPPYGPQCENVKDHDGDHAFPPPDRSS